MYFEPVFKTTRFCKALFSITETILDFANQINRFAPFLLIENWMQN